jgi:hypothetical protein
MDVIGPILIRGFNSSRYFITFLYNKSKFTRVYLIKLKGEVIDYFIYFKNRYKRRELGETIYRL